VLAAVGAAWGDLVRVFVAPIMVLTVVAAGWSALVRRGMARIAFATVAAAVAIAVIVIVLTADAHGYWLVAVVALATLSITVGRAALRPEPRTVAAAEHSLVGPARRGVLIVNPRSGGGKVERFDLAQRARERGVEPVVLRPGDELLAVARAAVEHGADVIGMAGGDGSQGLVASVAMEARLPFVCVPAGTRNHFALDLGLDRDDVVGALDAFGEAVERRVDLAAVGERVFVNNVSMGVYAKVVQSPEYRDAKRETTSRLLPELLGPGTDGFTLRFTGPHGREHQSAQIVLVSNNPYVLTALGGFGTRPRLDTGELGIATAEVRSSTDAAAMVAAEAAGRPQRYRGFREWTAPTFVVDSDEPIEAAVDGEAVQLDPPLTFRSLPRALVVRLPPSAPGLSPAAARPRSAVAAVGALVRVALGRMPS
jgi:diacylglycerol kinase family enzyme